MMSVTLLWYRCWHKHHRETRWPLLGYTVSTLPVASHTAGDIVRVSPKFPAYRIMDALNDDLRDLSTPDNGIFQMKTTSFTYNASTAPDAADPSFSRKTIKANSLMGQVRISQEALEDIPNIAGYITQRLATKMASAEGAAYISGTGSGQPQGIETNAIQSQLTNNVVMGSNTVFDFDEFFELQGKFKTAYQGNMKWYFNMNTLGALRKVQDTQGNYLWQGALGGASEGHPATIAGRPYTIFPSLPNLGASTHPVYCGDMRQAYKIIQKVGVSLVRLNEFQYPNILFVARTRVGGDLVLPEALGFLKGAA